MADGSEFKPFKISTRTEFEDINRYADGALGLFFVQTNDIDFAMSAVDIEMFRGSYDGQCHVIYRPGIALNSGSCGLFNVLDGGQIRNLTIRSPNMYSQTRNPVDCGFLVGTMKSRVSNGRTTCSSVQNIRIENARFNILYPPSAGSFGGIVGHADAGSNISFCKITTSSTSLIDIPGLTSVGGICGRSNGVYIYGCENQMSIQSLVAGSNVGGMIGTSDTASGVTTIVRSCCNRMELVGSVCAGVIGQIWGDSKSRVVISSCFNRGIIRGVDKAAGIFIQDADVPIKIEFTYQASNVESAGVTGAFMIANDVSSVSFSAPCYWANEFTFTGMIISENVLPNLDGTDQLNQEHAVCVWLAHPDWHYSDGNYPDLVMIPFSNLETYEPWRFRLYTCSMCADVSSIPIGQYAEMSYSSGDTRVHVFDGALKFLWGDTPCQIRVNMVLDQSVWPHMAVDIVSVSYSPQTIAFSPIPSITLPSDVDEIDLIFEELKDQSFEWYAINSVDSIAISVANNAFTISNVVQPTTVRLFVKLLPCGSKWSHADVILMAGLKGQRGNVGDIGPDGVQGIQGERGIQGVLGPKGESGDDGDIGPVGINGFDGAVGDKGQKGQQGKQGGQGAKGHAGPDGVRGNVGSAGANGVTGEKGNDGEDGLVGKDGPQGVQGVKGIQGADGIQGEQGNPGLQGAQGPTGIQGLMGQDGLRGLRGPKGLPGTKGAPGVKGVTGAAGNRGPRGVTEHVTSLIPSWNCFAL